MISKGKCTWTKPIEIVRIADEGRRRHWLDEVSGNKSRGRGYAVGTLANGDEMYVRTQVSQ